jgi:MFS family permease
MATNRQIFFGWWILAALFIAYSITNGVILNTLPLFYPELIKDFGWTQDEVTRPAQLLFLLVAIFSPIVGYFMDKISIKRMMLGGTLLILLGFVLFSFISSLGQLLGAYLLFALGITMAGIIPSMKIITNWFVKNRGLAVGLLLVGSSLGGAVFNQLAAGLIAAQGWRMALLNLGIMAAGLILIPLLWVVKEHPSQKNLYADGNTEKEEDTINAKAVGGGGVTLAGASQTLSFYLLLFITGAMWFCIVGVIQHQALFIKDLNTAIPSANILSLFFLCSILGKVIFGKLSDVYPKQRIMFFSVLNLVLGTLILSLVNTNPGLWLWLYALVFGIGFSGTFTMIQLLIAEFYAGASYGRILGIFTMVDTIAGVAGIMTLGKLRTQMGSYQQAFTILLILSIVAAVCVLLLKKKQVAND